jgi:hypothetical protein
MSDYRRYFLAEGTYFFTVVTEGREHLFTSAAARQLRDGKNGPIAARRGGCVAMRDGCQAQGCLTYGTGGVGGAGQREVASTPDVLRRVTSRPVE